VTRKEEVVSTNQEIVSVAARVLAGQMDPIEGCRWIVRHQSLLSEEQRRDAAILTLVGIESETDHFAVGAARQNWEPDALAQQDLRKAEYLHRIEPSLLEACKAIVAKFS
jgi:hypothetical protein